MERSTAAGVYSINQSASDQEQQMAGKSTRQQPSSSNLHVGNSTRASAKPVPPLGAPPRGTTYGIEIEATQRTEVLDHQSSSEEREDADTSDECAPPHFVDIFAGRNRPMSRAMEWCGWTTNSFEKFPAGCKCGWKCKCGKTKDVRLDCVQTEIFNHMQKAQATWIALDSCTLTKVSSPMTGQEHLPKPLRSAENLWSKFRTQQMQQWEAAEPRQRTFVGRRAKLAVGTQRSDCICRGGSKDHP